MIAYRSGEIVITALFEKVAAGTVDRLIFRENWVKEKLFTQCDLFPAHGVVRIVNCLEQSFSLCGDRFDIAGKSHLAECLVVIMGYRFFRHKQWERKNRSNKEQADSKSGKYEFHDGTPI